MTYALRPEGAGVYVLWFDDGLTIGRCGRIRKFKVSPRVEAWKVFDTGNRVVVGQVPTRKQAVAALTRNFEKARASAPGALQP